MGGKPPPKRRLANWLQAYMRYTASSEAPDRMHFWTGVATIAGALRRRVWIDLRYFQWTPNFYIILVAPAGVISKSSTADIGMRMLRQVEGVRFGPSAITWQALVQSLAEALELVDMDGSGINGTATPMSCLTISSSELGSFLDPRNREMIDVLTDLWDSKKGVWDKRTKGSGEEVIENPWINFIGCTTPAWMKEHLPAYVIGGGFMSRVVLVHGDTKRRLVPYPHLEVPADHEQQEADLIHDLRLIAELKGAYTIAPDAEEWGYDWYMDHWDASKVPHYLIGDQFGGYRARKQTHIHKLAMVLAASQRDELVLTKDDLFAASQIVSTLEPEMAHAFESIGGTPSTKLSGEVLAIARAYKRILRRDLHRICFNKMTGAEFDEAVNSAIAAGYLTQSSDGTGLWLTATHVQEKEDGAEANVTPLAAGKSASSAGSD